MIDWLRFSKLVEFTNGVPTCRPLVTHMTNFWAQDLSTPQERAWFDAHYATVRVTRDSILLAVPWLARLMRAADRATLLWWRATVAPLWRVRRRLFSWGVGSDPDGMRYRRDLVLCWRTSGAELDERRRLAMCRRLEAWFCVQGWSERRDDAEC